VLLVLLALQPVIRVGNGVDGARSIQAAQLRSVARARNIAKVSDIDVLDDLSFYQPVSLTRMQVRFAEALHLTLFAGSGHSHGTAGAVEVAGPNPAGELTEKQLSLVPRQAADRQRNQLTETKRRTDSTERNPASFPVT
jgi:hypothetical protein